MTLAARIRSNKARQGGFSLLEIVIVLLVIALIAGGAITMMVLSSDERVLNDATDEVQSLAKRARTIAGLQQRPYALEFYDGTVTMMPLAEAVLEPDRRAAAADALEAAGQAGGGRFHSEHASWSVEEGTEMFIRRWASDEFLPATGKNRQVWRFDPEGPCEPITVRFQIGKSWMEAEFNPLTAGIRGMPAKEIH